MIGVIERRAEIAVADLPPIDYDQFEAGLGQDPELLRELVPMFLEDAQSCMNCLATAIQVGDAEGVRVAGHTLAGTASAFAASAVTGLARQLERLGATGDLTGAGEVFVALERALARVRPLLEVLAADR